MQLTEIKNLVLQTISKIAPESNLESLKPDVRFRDQFDFDSVDFVNFIAQLQEVVQSKIPETDYPQLATLNGCIAYLGEKNQMQQNKAGEPSQYSRVRASGRLALLRDPLYPT